MKKHLQIIIEKLTRRTCEQCKYSDGWLCKNYEKLDYEKLICPGFEKRQKVNQNTCDKIYNFYTSKNWKKVKKFYYSFSRQNGKTALSLKIHLRLMYKYCLKKRKYITAFRIKKIMKTLEKLFL